MLIYVIITEISRAIFPFSLLTFYIQICLLVLKYYINLFLNMKKVNMQKLLLLRYDMYLLTCLQTEKIELETTVVDETMKRESYSGQGRRFSG